MYPVSYYYENNDDKIFKINNENNILNVEGCVLNNEYFYYILNLKDSAKMGYNSIINYDYMQLNYNVFERNKTFIDIVPFFDI